MEKSGKRKSGGVKIPKRSRSLDLKSLYKPRVSKGGESKGKVSQGNDEQNVGKKRRRSKKEVSLSQFESDAKKSKKDDVNDVKPEQDSSQKSGGGSEGLHVISLSLGENGSAFNFPKRPRGSVGRKKLQTDQAPNLLEHPESGDSEGTFNAGINDEVGTSGKSIELDVFSASNDGLSKSKSAGKVIYSNMKYVGRGAGSNSKFAGKGGNSKSKSRSVGKAAGTNSKALGKIDDSNSKPQEKVISSNVKQKLKSDSQFTGKVMYSNIKLKRKTGIDELKDSGNGGSGSMYDAAKENATAVNSGGTSSKKQWTSSKKKKNLVDGDDSGKLSKKSKLSIGGAVSTKIGAAFDEGDEEENREQNNVKENVVAVNSGDTTSKKQRIIGRKKKDLMDGKDGVEASKKKSEPSLTNLVSDKIVADFNEGDDEANPEKNNGKENVVGVNSEDTSKMQRTNSKKKKDLIDGKDGGSALKNKSQPSVGTSVSHKIVDGFDEGDDVANLKQNGGKESFVVNTGDMPSKKRRSNIKKKKDLVDDKDDREASKKPEPSASSVSVKIVAGVDGEEDDEANLKQDGGNDTPAKKRRANSRRKKDLVDGKDGEEAPGKKPEPFVTSSISDKIVADFDEEDDDDDDDDDDEENLEQNAARMLSSRFDPSCTGFPSKRKSSACQNANECSFPESSTLDSLSQQINSAGGVDAEPVGDDSRALRPRREDKGKGEPNMGEPRKRRHFYEIPPKELKPQWVLDRKIKVFWPLDESWYYGQVNNYHPECKLYHIKYDDRDEEWIDLNEERFKLLLYPSEVPGRDKSKKSSKVGTGVHKVESVVPEDGDNSIEIDRETETIASWLARSSQRGKSFPKSLKSQGPPDVELGTVASRSYLEADRVDYESTVSAIGTLNTAQLVYARKKIQTGSEGNGAVSRYVKAYGNTSDTVDPISVSLPATEKVDSEKQIWSVDHEGNLWLNVSLVESKKLTFQMRLPSLPCWESSLQTADSSLLHDLFMVQHGLLLPPSSSVVLEMLLIDSYRGLNFFLFEGCNKQALAFIFEILNFFSQASELMDHDMQSPVTSIRFRLSGVQDQRKHHLFELHSFYRLQSSKWVCLKSRLLHHCHLLKKLRASECTYDNIKELERWSVKPCEPHVGSQLSSHMYQGRNKASTFGIVPSSISRQAYTTWTSQSALYLPEKPGEVPTFVLVSSVAPSFLLTRHLQILVENNSAAHQCQHDLHEQSLESLPVAVTSIPSQESDHGSESRPDHMFVDLSSTDQVPFLLDGNESTSRQASEVASNVNEVYVPLDGKESISRQGSYFARNLNEVLDVARNVNEVHVVLGGKESISRQSSDVARNVNEVLVPLDGKEPISTRGSDVARDGNEILVLLDGKESISRQAFDVASNVNEDFNQNPNPAGARSLRGRTSSVSMTVDRYPKWTDTTPKFMRRGFSSGPKKPRSLVQYAMPGADHDFVAKQKIQNQRSVPGKRIKRDSLKRISDASGGNRKNFEFLVCDANVLVTQGDRGWRECGALIVLEVAEHNEWRLAVKLSGITKYSYKVNHILQPGSTNRYSHAVLWKGGKDWVLEFADRNQWNLFKEIHEECYNRNVRAASVKNIPIPGVQPIEECDDYGIEAPFVQNPTKYIRQLQNDVEMAMDPSHVLYDMDSDDEQWLMSNQECVNEKGFEDISEDILEKTMDVFEKASYVKHRDNFTLDELQELAAGMGSVESIKLIYNHWWEKRGRRGMPLIRHLQPPLWEKYQQQVEWENAVAQGNTVTAAGIQEKAPFPEKPAMFAFCLKPRGLEIRNKSFKQKSHRKYPASAHLHPSSGTPSNFFIYGRRSSGDTYHPNKVFFRPNIHDSSNISSLPPSMRLLSPRDAHYHLTAAAAMASPSPRVYQTKQKKHCVDPPSDNQQTASCRQRKVGRKNGVQQQNMGFPNSSSQMDLENMDDSDLLNECHLRDASAAAQHALEVAKLKRERAKRLFEKADVAVQKAIAAVMTAEAIKGACEAMNGGSCIVGMPMPF